MIVFFLFPSIHEPPSFLPFPFSLSFPFYSRDLSSLSPLEYQLIQALFSSQLISRFVSLRLIKGRNVILVSYSLFDERWIFLPWDNRETRRKPRPRAASCPGYSRVRRGRANVQECVNVGYTRDLRCAQPTKRLHRLIHRVFSPRKWKCSDDAFVKLPRMHLLRDGNEDEPGRAITGQKNRWWMSRDPPHSVKYLETSCSSAEVFVSRSKDIEKWNELSEWKEMRLECLRQFKKVVNGFYNKWINREDPILGGSSW